MLNDRNQRPEPVSERCQSESTHMQPRERLSPQMRRMPPLSGHAGLLFRCALTR